MKQGQERTVERTQGSEVFELKLPYKGGMTVYIPREYMISDETVRQLTNIKNRDNDCNMSNEGVKWINLGYGGTSNGHKELHIHRPSRTVFPFGIVKSTTNFVRYLKGEMTIQSCSKVPPFSDEDYIRPRRGMIKNSTALLFAHILSDIVSNGSKQKALLETGNLPFRFWCSRTKWDTFSNGKYVIEGFEDGRNSVYIIALTIARDLLSRGMLTLKAVTAIVNANTIGNLYDGIWDMPADWTSTEGNTSTVLEDDVESNEAVN